MAAIERRVFGWSAAMAVPLAVLLASGCASAPIMEEPDDWLARAAAESADAAAPIAVPARRLERGERARIDLEAAALEAEGERVRQSAPEAVSDEPSAEAFARQARERAQPPG